MQVVNILIKLVLLSLNPSRSYVFTIPSHTSHLISLSSGDEIDSRLDLTSTAKAGIQHETQGKVERTPLSNQVMHRLWECPYPWTWLYVQID
jgi:hypothetical protein